MIHNKIVVGAEIGRIIEHSSPAGASQFKTFIGARYTLLNFGYLMYSKKGLMYYPLLGLGLGELKLRTTEHNISSFDDISSYQRGSESRTTNLLINLGFGLDYFFKYDKRKKGKNNIVIGARIGYLLSPVRFDWKVNHVRVPDGPNTGISGPYIRFTIGLGGWIENLIRVA
ncbi:MAG: hypothetical protein GY940_42660, partial [bacterium]|nr:hypothetical protein [bacterium]